jgi:hypothetical protein
MNQNYNTFSKVIWDLDEFIQREGYQMDKILLRSKLQLVHRLLKTKNKQKRIIRGLLNRLNKMTNSLILLKLTDFILFLRNHTDKSVNNQIFNHTRKITLIRITQPFQLLLLTNNENLPLKIELKI